MIDLSPASGPPEKSWSDRFHPAEPWLDQRKKALGLKIEDSTGQALSSYAVTPFSGGQTKLSGAAYFDFFTWLMLGTAVAFIPFAMLYRPKTYLQD